MLVPPGGWTIELDGLGPKIVSNNWSDFITQIRVRLEANGADKHGWKPWAINLMCEQRPDIPYEDDEERQSRAMTGDDVIRFLKSMWVSKEEGAIAVSQELQDKRVETCLACPKLGYISCFVGCSSIVETLAKFAIGRSIRRHADIHKMSCLACGCTAEVKTMWPLDVLHEIDKRMGTSPEYHPSCWILTEAQNPPNTPPPESSSAQPAELETN